MDREVVLRKLEALRHCVQRVRERRPASATLLASDEDAQDVLVLNLSRAVQLCVDIAAHQLAGTNQPAPATMGDAFTGLAISGAIDAELAARLRRAVGFRNIAVHNYQTLDWGIVFELAGDPLSDFDQFAAVIVSAAQA